MPNSKANPLQNTLLLRAVPTLISQRSRVIKRHQSLPIRVHFNVRVSRLTQSEELHGETDSLIGKVRRKADIVGGDLQLR